MDLIEQLTRDEGSRVTPYQDTVGKTTIGVGRNLTDVGVSQDEIDLMLRNDIENAKTKLEAALPWVTQLDEIRHAALVNMAFNMGIHGLLGFRDFLGKMKAGDWTAAAAAMLDSKWAEQVGPRAHRLSIQIAQGLWQ